MEEKKGVIGMAKFFWNESGWRHFALLVLLVLAGLSEGLGIVTLLPLLSIAVNEGSADQTGVGRFIQTVLTTMGLTPGIGGMLVLIVVALTLKAGLVLLAARQLGFTAARSVRNLRIELIESLMKARWQYYLGRPSGALANSITTEAQYTATAFTRIFAALADTIQVAVYTGVALLVSWEITVAALLVGGLSAFILSGIVRITTRAGLRQNRLLKSVATRLVDGMQGIKPLRAMACENLLGPFLESETRRLEKAEQDYVFSREGLTALQECFMAVTLAGALYAALTLWHVDLALLMVFGILFWRTVNRIGMVQRSYQDASAFQNHFWSLRSEIELAKEQRETTAPKERPQLNRDITLRDVHFSYDEAPVLRDVWLTIPCGRITAVIGPSGSGKTTIADLITGLIRPQRGDVWIDDLPMSEVDMRAWRKMIGYVPQETLLFHASLLTNVTLGDSDIRREEAEKALRAAGAWTFVSSLPDTMETVTGERGGKLSGGQRQRISLARALARKPQLLVLDEATSGLDAQTEAEILATLAKLKGDVTILAISHQPAVVMAADVVYQLETGMVHENAGGLEHFRVSTP